MLDIHPDITRAWTPHSEFYTSDAAFQHCREKVFARSWQFVGDETLARVPGQVHPFNFLDGCIDEPLLLSRDRDDQLRCLSNICTHRGMVVCEGAGVHNSLRCRYHGRRFGLDGTMQFMPEFEVVQDFPSACDNLRQVQLANWKGLLFAALDPLSPFEEVMAPMLERLDWLPLQDFRFEPNRAREYSVRCHWALYVDNYLEGFHIPYVHASLNDVLDYGNYTTECYDWGNLQIGVGDDTFDQDPGVSAFYYWFFPNLMFNFYPWGLSINVVRPLSPTHTKVQFLPYVWQEGRISQGAGADLDRVEREDEAIVEQVQRGVQSRIYQRGRYSPKREQNTHHFHRLLAQAFSGE